MAAEELPVPIFGARRNRSRGQKGNALRHNSSYDSDYEKEKKIAGLHLVLFQKLSMCSISRLDLVMRLECLVNAK